MASNSLYLFSDLKLEVAENLGDPSDIGLASSGKFINRALMRISEIGEWPFLLVQAANFATVASTETYSLAVGVRRLLALYVTGTSARKLRLLNNREFREMYPNPSAVGSPWFYRRAGKDGTTGAEKVSLYSIPSAVETISYDYIKMMPLMVNDSDDVRTVVGLPEHMIDALIELATAIGMRKYDDADYENAMAEALVRWSGLYGDYTNEIDDRIVARSFDGSNLDARFDPVLPGNFSE